MKQLIHYLKNLPPTPFPCFPIIGHLHLLFKHNSSLPRTLAKLSESYGPILYLWFGFRPVLVVSSPLAVEQSLGQNDLIFAGRPQLIAGKIIGYNNSILLLASDTNHCRNLRRILTANILSPIRLKFISAVCHDEALSVIRQLYKSGHHFCDQSQRNKDSELAALAATGSVIAVKDQQMVDMNALFYDFTYQVMVRMIVGKHDGSRWVSKNGNKFKEVLKKMYEISGSIYTRDILPLVRNMRSEKRMRVIHEKSDEMLQELLEEERSRMTSSCCMVNKDMSVVQVLLTMQTTHPTTYTDDILKGVILVLFLAGVDTSASTMEWIMTLLLNNPFALMKAQAEIDEQIGHGRIVEEADLRNLNYVRCIINETLRMYPTVPMLLPHESSKDCLVGRYHIPRGTMLLVNVWGIHNNPQLWDNPKKFMPERFEGINENQVGYKFMPFGSGRRRCPGENLAMRVIGQLIGLLIQCFEWERTSEELINMEERVRLTMLKVKPLRAKFGPRLSMLNQISQI
ncbi:cytochrome P450 81Q32-like [Silene latifolia]|uniref:cytochrome P450 81Q32-like n=1 Tax=Silene latifolia TaxID=37657 RepID=UPI003D76B607